MADGRGRGRAVTVKYEVKGLQELDRALKQLPPELDNKVLQKATDDAMKEALPALQHAAPKHATGEQSAASKEYGSVLANLGTVRKKSVRKGQKGSLISTGNAFWSWFYEFGTRHQPARPWFVPAFRGASRKVLDKLSSALGDGIEKAFEKLLRK